MENKNLYFIYFFILFMLLGILILSVIFYNEQIQECKTNPLVYGAKQYQTDNYRTIIGTLTIVELGKNPLMIYFNEEKVSIGPKAH